MRSVIAALLVMFASLAQAQALKKVVLFGQPSVNNDSIWMALQYGYFKEQGLEVEYRVFPSGTTAFQTFRTGQGDIVMTGDLPSVQYFFNNPAQYQTFAAIERDAKSYVIIARKDIKSAKDLAGKTVATRVGSTGSWFISEYLSKNGVDPKGVPVKNLDTQLLPAALCKGDISAFFIWQPIGSRTLEICPNDAHQLADATGYIQGYLVAGARNEFLASADGADKVQRFLRALLKGRAKAESDFKAVAEFAAKTYSLSEKATRDQWETNIRPIALDKVYFDDFCSLSKWAQGTGLQTGTLDFSKFTWPNALRAIDPKLAIAPPAPC
jgi:ABC-type nitrate/sulfonate/bicarbonate transport system substrate-binding protein